MSAPGLAACSGVTQYRSDVWLIIRFICSSIAGGVPGMPDRSISWMVKRPSHWPGFSWTLSTACFTCALLMASVAAMSPALSPGWSPQAPKAPVRPTSIKTVRRMIVSLLPSPRPSIAHPPTGSMICGNEEDVLYLF